AGIVCATEGNATGLGKQGWGIADASSAPYFITGVTSGWANTSQSDVKIAKSTLVHVVGVYDDAADKICLYVNGVCIKEAAASTFVASGADEKYEGFHIGNTFGLGGDPTVTGSGICDFPAKDLVIVDANIYMGALTADEVATLCSITSLRTEDYVNEKIYADIDFEDNTAYDAEWNVDFEVKGDAEKVTTGEYTVKYGTKDVTVTGINIKKGGWVLGTFNSLADNTVVDEAVAAAGGFTVEAFYANMNPTGFVGIVCATEGNAAEVNKAKQGWGLADNAKAPYFITGNGSWCTTNPSGANVEAGTLVHVVGVYDDVADKICLYVNGVCIKEAAATGFTVSGASEKGTDENGGYLIGNTFGLGGDPTVQGGLCDYNAVDLIIVDAKIYMGALTAEDVAIAYTNAIAPYAG
ncbi:MAG: hypothetical protein IJW21_07550, partial [Clostridia bacterium]|nr:hypothetical protein [Clostridia bacterium]